MSNTATPSFTYDVQDQQGTDALGAALAGSLPDGSVVALIGTLGAGKTALVQAVAAAEGVARGVVTSPTFVLVNEYDGARKIYHLDTYRLADDDEFLGLGPEEFFDSAGLTFVEWADRFPACLPAARLEISIEVTGDQARRFCLLAHGSRYEPALAKLVAILTA
ncbi:MAG: tRNA (adenosine(37)-N6)-threonylcarbamoyltransferase complex ATPase subunit type 1 TsaE [Pirellulales bacterium]|nr:tRNA (adenosine(37)-N6)-threonylcarbamoyltransferase complex ATPase subunit type 1 TsaE [Pirellulales bacterium]